jgi:hypothetical protein
MNDPGILAPGVAACRGSIGAAGARTAQFDPCGDCSN